MCPFCSTVFLFRLNYVLSIIRVAIVREFTSDREKDWNGECVVFVPFVLLGRISVFLAFELVGAEIQLLVSFAVGIYSCFHGLTGNWAVGEEGMEGDEEHQVALACAICGALFCVLSPFSFWILWSVNWRPWRIYRFSINFSCGAYGSVLACRMIHN